MRRMKVDVAVSDSAVRVAAAIVVVALACWGVWQLASSLDPTTLKVWTLLATAAVFPAVWFGYWLGATESRGKVAGLDLGVNRVIEAATRTADLRATAASAMRRAVSDGPQELVLLPEPPITVQRLAEGEVIDV